MRASRSDQLLQITWTKTAAPTRPAAFRSNLDAVLMFISLKKAFSKMKSIVILLSYFWPCQPKSPNFFLFSDFFLGIISPANSYTSYTFLKHFELRNAVLRVDLLLLYLFDVLVSNENRSIGNIWRLLFWSKYFSFIALRTLIIFYL